jgi:hypothetical protein
MGNVRRFTMKSVWNHDFRAVTLDVTNFQSPSSSARRKSQSNHEVWLGMSSTGPVVSSTSGLKER